MIITFLYVATAVCRDCVTGVLKLRVTTCSINEWRCGYHQGCTSWLSS